MEYKRFTENVDSGFVSELDCRIAYNKLCGIENKIEQGTLIELPCKVGDTVYRIRQKPYKAALERTVVSVSICMNYKGNVEWRLFTTAEDTLGKTVFLTREEAEKRLKELQG